MRGRYPILLLVLALLVPAALAQEFRGNLIVTVTDEAKNPIVGATGTLTGKDFTRSAVTNEIGELRFIKLDPGVYDLRIVMVEYRPVTYQGVTINTQANVSMTIPLPKATEIKEEITVTSRTPLLDKRKSGTSTVMTTQELTQVPQVRDPWSILMSVPGVTTDRVNIGGSEAGQQSNFSGKGDNGSNTNWVMDGAEFTDMGAKGSGTYLDFNSFKEVSVSTSGNDFEQFTPGMRVNFVTKQGANKYTGTMRMLYASDSQQWNNESGELKEQNAGTPAKQYYRIIKTFEKNFDIGGPIVPDYAWFWFGFTENQVDLLRGSADKTTLKNWSLKANGVALENKFTYKAFYSNGEKLKYGRTFLPLQDEPTKWDQTGPSPLWTFDVSYFFTPKLEMALQYSRSSSTFYLVPKAKGTDDDTQSVIGDDGILHNTAVDYGTKRPGKEYAARGNAFVTTGKWDHELKFGYKYREASVVSTSKYGTQDVYAYSGGLPIYAGKAYIIRQANKSYSMKYNTLWAGDTITTGPWTINAGLTYTKQTSEQQAAYVPAPAFCELGNLNANGIVCEPELTFPGADFGFAWKDLLPRLGVSYVFEGKHRLLLRANYGEYVDSLGGGVADYGHPAGQSRVAFSWGDLDNNNMVNPWNPALLPYRPATLDAEGNIIDPGCTDPALCNEIDPASAAFTNFDPENLSGIVNIVDKNLKAPKTKELILGGEYELLPDFTLGAAVTFRKKDRFFWMPIIGVSQSDYVKHTETMEDPQGGTYTYNYWTLNVPEGVTKARNRIMTNRPGYNQNFKGLELTATKRLSNKWMMRAFFAYSDWKQDVSASSLQDPTTALIPVGTDATYYLQGVTVDGTPVLEASTSSGPLGDVFFTSSKWQLGANGLYQLPNDWTISGNFFMRQGYLIPRFIRLDDPKYVDTDGTGATKFVLVGQADSYRLPTITDFDLKLAKSIHLKDANVEVSLELFNLFNAGIVQGRNRRINDTRNFNKITYFMSPRVLRFGAAFQF